MSESKKIKALVASGGGAWGAWGGGTIEGLYKCHNKEYDVFIGSSTGVLLAPLSALKEMDRLKDAYTSVTTKDIFNVNPFNKKGGIKILNVLWRALIVNPVYKIFTKGHKPTLGESKPLRETIKKFFTSQDYQRLREEGLKEIVAAVTNLNSGFPEFKSSHDYDYEDFVDWMWASSCVPLWMSLLKKEGAEYADGGVLEHIPIQAAIDRGAEEIDVIVHRPEEYANDTNYVSTNAIKLLVRVNDIMHREISRDDVAISRLKSIGKDVTINIFYTPYKLSKNSLMFDKKIMAHWWNLGVKGIEEENSKCDTWTLSKGNVLKRKNKY